MKTLETKQIYAYIVHNNLKRTPPKEYPDTEEMMITVDEVLPALEKVSGKFVEYRKQAEEINNQASAGKITQPEAMEKLGVLQKEVRGYEIENESVRVTIELESGAYGALLKQFDRWGKTWFDRVEDFVNLKKDIAKVS